jgi:HAD superfamily hydrolase (TIGR01458 family)
MQFLPPSDREGFQTHVPSAYLFDLDGTLYTDAGRTPGGPELLRRLRDRKVPYRFVTNTTSRPRRLLVERLRGCGYDVGRDEIQTPITAALTVARARGYRVVAPFVPIPALEDLEGFKFVGGTAFSGTTSPSAHPDAVIIGDLGEAWTFEHLQQAFEYLMQGADLLALSRDRYFLTTRGLTLDAGPFVAALEYATGKGATVAGKPSPDFFRAAAAGLGLPQNTDPREIAMVGDDLWSDVEGAQRAGYQGWLVRTGKFREDRLRESGIVPDRVIESVASVE